MQEYLQISFAYILVILYTLNNSYIVYVYYFIYFI